jgi:hypothetical protein
LGTRLGARANVMVWDKPGCVHASITQRLHASCAASGGGRWTSAPELQVEQVAQAPIRRLANRQRGRSTATATRGMTPGGRNHNPGGGPCHSHNSFFMRPEMAFYTARLCKQ